PIAEEVLVVSVTLGSKRSDECRSPTSARASCPLGIVRRRRWDIAQEHRAELANVDAQLHCRRAEEDRQEPGAEVALAGLAVRGIDLARVLASQHAAKHPGSVAVELGEIL